eukprot:TRINITY_DN5843_c0_g1_i1.p1 TRINITY_DN5843_c0_g1~~TRINITY_DN5843_c0_g1_i1.p1  ORF type:complete len:322 (+),score=54.30 TRINITY_DN5843_c0_g1_i1:48-968(+)
MESVFGANKKPSNTAFAQQKLPAWQPILTPLPVIISFLVLGVVFMPLGGVLYWTSTTVIEVKSDEYQSCGALGTACTFNFDGLNMEPPIYVYYELSNYYQNHRRYVKSRSDDQLRGVLITSVEDIETCDPFASEGGSSNPDLMYLPCGLIANSVFNDTYVLSGTGADVPMTKEGVAWESDIKEKFKNPNVEAPGIRTVANVEDPDFVNWMRTAGLPTFRKLWRIIEVPLEGDYTMTVSNNYPVESFGGKKRVILSTTSWMGGKNDFLGIAYIVVGAICWFLAAVFAIKHKVSGRAPGDTSFLEWAR